MGTRNCRNISEIVYHSLNNLKQLSNCKEFATDLQSDKLLVVGVVSYCSTIRNFNSHCNFQFGRCSVTRRAGTSLMEKILQVEMNRGKSTAILLRALGILTLFKRINLWSDERVCLISFVSCNARNVHKDVHKLHNEYNCDIFNT